MTSLPRGTQFQIHGCSGSQTLKSEGLPTLTVYKWNQMVPFVHLSELLTCEGQFRSPRKKPTVSLKSTLRTTAVYDSQMQRAIS